MFVNAMRCGAVRCCLCLGEGSMKTVLVGLLQHSPRVRLSGGRECVQHSGAAGHVRC